MSGYNFQKSTVFFCLKICFTFANSVDPDEMQHNAAFHLGLHCLQKYSFRGFSNKSYCSQTGHLCVHACVCVCVPVKMI